MNSSWNAYRIFFLLLTEATKIPRKKILPNTQGNVFNIFIIKWHSLSLGSCRRPLPVLLSNLIIFSSLESLVFKVLARIEKNNWIFVEKWILSNVWFIYHMPIFHLLPPRYLNWYRIFNDYFQLFSFAVWFSFVIKQS